MPTSIILPRWYVILGFTACYFVLCAPPSAYAWGIRAHRIVAHITTIHLSLQSQREIAKIINTRSLADIAGDADNWRKERPETSPWHYVNIPFDASTYEADRDCPNGDCVIAAITKYRDILANRHYGREARQEALTFLVHLVADAHQPLHCIDNSDHGGNDVVVTFFGKPTNLHAIWDSELLFRTRLGERAYVHRLMTLLAPQNVEGLQRGTLVDWVLEAHEVARIHAYHLPANHDMRSDYYSATLSIVDNQLAKAGVRLARLLNDALQTSARRTL